VGELRELVELAIGGLLYQSRKVFDEVLRHRLRDLAGNACSLPLSPIVFLLPIKVHHFW
jgi:hypothetical protein